MTMQIRAFVGGSTKIRFRLRLFFNLMLNRTFFELNVE